MPSRHYRCYTAIPLRRSSRVARRQGLIDAVTEACIMEINSKTKRSPMKRRPRAKQTGRRIPSGEPVNRRPFVRELLDELTDDDSDATDSDVFVYDPAVRNAIAAAQAAADAAKAAADAADLLNRYAPPLQLPEEASNGPLNDHSNLSGFDADGEIMCGQPLSPVF